MYSSIIYCPQLPELLRLLGEYLDNLHSAKEALSLAFTNEEFTLLVQVCRCVCVSLSNTLS